MTLTMRPHFWRIMSWTSGARQRHRRVGVDGDEELPLLGRHLPELDRALPVVAAHRRLADPGIVDKDVDHPETAARLGDDLIDRLVAGEIGLDRHQIGALLALLRRLGELGETLGGAVDRRDREPRQAGPAPAPGRCRRLRRSRSPRAAVRSSSPPFGSSHDGATRGHAAQDNCTHAAPPSAPTFPRTQSADRVGRPYAPCLHRTTTNGDVHGAWPDQMSYEGGPQLARPRPSTNRRMRSTQLGQRFAPSTLAFWRAHRPRPGEHGHSDRGPLPTRPGGSHRPPLTSGLRPIPAVRMPTGEGVESIRGRDVRLRMPPAQIRTSGFPASGSYLGCLTAKRMLGQG